MVDTWCLQCNKKIEGRKRERENPLYYHHFKTLKLHCRANSLNRLSLEVSDKQWLYRNNDICVVKWLCIIFEFNLFQFCFLFVFVKWQNLNPIFLALRSHFIIWTPMFIYTNIPRCSAQLTSSYDGVPVFCFMDYISVVLAILCLFFFSFQISFFAFVTQWGGAKT